MNAVAADSPTSKLGSPARLSLYIIAMIFVYLFGREAKSMTFAPLSLLFWLLQGVCGFILLTMVPGLLILYALGIDPFERGVNLLYSVGLSQAFLLFLTLSLNVLNLIEVKPFTFVNLLAGLVLGLVLLMGISLMKYKGSFKDAKGFPLHKYLALGMLPLISIFGALLVDVYANNVVILALLFALSAIPLLARNIIPADLYPFAIFSTALALQFHKNFVTNYVIGADIQYVYHSANLVRELQAWDPRLGGDTPLIVMAAIPVIYSTLLDLSLDWTMKILNSFLYALAPTAIFYVFKARFGERDGLYASLFFAYQVGYLVYGTPAKQPVAETFLAMLLLAAIDGGVKDGVRAALMAVYSLLIVNSHYGTSYILMLSMLIAYIIYVAANREETVILKRSYIIFFMTLTFSWYIYAGEGDLFARFIGVLRNAVREIWLVLEMGKILHRSGRALAQNLLTRYVVLYQINAAIYLLLTALMIIGVIYAVYKVMKGRGKLAFIDALAIVLLFFLFASFYITASFGFDRMYVLSSVVLSGYLFNGYRALHDILRKNFPRTYLENDLTLLMALLLSVFILFNTGVIYYLAETPIESAVSLNPYTNTLAYWDAEIRGAYWTVQNLINEGRIFTDYYSDAMFRRYYGPLSEKIYIIKVNVKLEQLYNILTKIDVIGLRTRSISYGVPSGPQYIEVAELIYIQRELLLGRIYDSGAYYVFIRGD